MSASYPLDPIKAPVRLEEKGAGDQLQLSPSEEPLPPFNSNQAALSCQKEGFGSPHSPSDIAGWQPSPLSSLPLIAQNIYSPNVYCDLTKFKGLGIKQ